MKTTKQLLGAVSAVALVAMSSAPALAAGTSAGTTITNNVSVSFNVGGVAQNAQTASNSFTVDQRVNVNVVNNGPATSVSPNQTNRVLSFDVTNLSNSTVDLALTTSLLGGTAANISNFRVFRDTNGNGLLDSAELTAGPITYLDEVAADATVKVLVVSDISINAANGNTFDVALIADAHAAGTANTLGAQLVGTSGANTAGIDTVLFDGAGTADAANDGAFSATGRYTVAGAVLTLAKTSRVISDPVNLTNNPKAIPGATVEYCITVANAAGAATATNVNVVDDLPADVTYSAAYGIFINGNATCTSGTAGGTFAAGAGVSGRDRISSALNDVAAGQTRSLYFQVVIK
ncbi:DUF11 domain-containing protein [Erythrobacter neustonensis]|uniref:DUF11 domain-containing protein n=1 Tax=Erythrobacter neustonensis TaxID=1112 RepID=A0A192D1Y7_9SPHN|nr:DUF11 domain-containing protein [Erythrobacter neustonensis]ANK11991.1 hypothetical protein A9D12_02515 [Erythrobacter neustonensis]